MAIAQVASAGAARSRRVAIGHSASTGAPSPWRWAGHTSGTGAATPIKHLVVIFQENVSFDHYFGTYPNATNPAAEPQFHALPGTPSVNGLSGPLLTTNPNKSNPQRLDRSQALTCDQDHDYTAEQSAFDHGLMDKTGGGLTLAQCLASVGNTAPAGGTNPNYAVMDYYDGNTVTGLWNYPALRAERQHVRRQLRPIDAGRHQRDVGERFRRNLRTERFRDQRLGVYGGAGIGSFHARKPARTGSWHHVQRCRSQLRYLLGGR